jgi:HSP20 family protein
LKIKTKEKLMYNRHSSAPFGAPHRGQHHPFMQSIFRAPVNVYKTESSYELLVFAPGRVKENFNVKTQGTDIIVSYKPQEGLQSPEWIKREYSRGAFERIFTFDDSVDTSNIKANYVDGVLQISLPIIPGKEVPQQDIPVN